MTRRALLALCLALAAVPSCAPTRSHRVSVAQAKNVRVYVSESPMLASSDDDCRLHYGVLEKSLPYAVRRALAQSGFTVVRRASDVHDAEAFIDANLSFCRKAGTCVNGNAEMTLVASGRVVERHRFDTGSAFCSSAPTVDEFPALFVQNLDHHLLDSEPVASLAQTASIIRAEFEAGRLAQPPVAAAPGTPVAAAAPAPAAPTEYALGAPQPNAFALVVGIEKYRDVPPPSGARADATSFAKLTTRTLGLPEENVRVLLDEHATRGDLEKGLSWLELNVPVGGRAFFFYSGHGAPDPVSGTAYLLPYDGDPAALDQTALPLTIVTERLARTKGSESVAFLDACFSGAGGRSVLPQGARPLVRVQAPSIARGVAVLSSSAASEIAGPSAEGDRGLFSKYLLQGLGEAQADADGDLQISMAELQAFVEPRVSREARLGNRVQTPTLVISDGRPGSAVIVASGVKR